MSGRDKWGGTRPRFLAKEGENRTACLLARLLRPLFWARVRGAEDCFRIVAAQDPLIFAFNHDSYLDTVLAAWFLLGLRRGRQVGFLVDWMFLSLPILAWVIRLCDPIPVWGKRGRWSWLEATRPSRPPSARSVAAQRLRQGRSLALFPEGKINSGGALLAFRRGAASLALDAQVPILPIGIDRRGLRVLIRCGDPLSVRQGKDQSREEAIAEATELLCRRIAELSGRGQREGRGRAA
jgi:1-acyl-sn-glycerol-3-phosphate acyltransferase